MIKRSGAYEPFSREKIISGVGKACQGRPVSEDDLARLAQLVEERIRANGASQIEAHEIGLTILEPLRDSRFVSDMAVWMPPGIMLILVLSTLSQGMQVAGGRWWAALVATGITIAVHLLSGRKLLWSVGAGTVAYIALLNWL